MAAHRPRRVRRDLPLQAGSRLYDLGQGFPQPARTATGASAMTSFERVDAIVKAVLYEGYMLYPYRPSSVKNRQRWTFGGVYPRDCAARDESLRATMQTECLLSGHSDTTVDIRVRFLHLLKREVGRLDEPLATFSAEREPRFTLVPHLCVGDQRLHA